MDAGVRLSPQPLHDTNPNVSNQVHNPMRIFCNSPDEMSMQILARSFNRVGGRRFVETGALWVPGDQKDFTEQKGRMSV
jgi:hypothetical protein